MKQKGILVILALTMLVLVLTTGCTGGKLADSFDKDTVTAKAKDVVQTINAKDYDAVNAQLRDDLQEQLTSQQLKDAIDARLQAVGAFQDYKSTAVVGTKDSKTSEDYAVVVLVCAYEKGTLTYTLSFDKDLKLVGLYFK